MIGAPPLEAGAVNVIVACVLPGVAVPINGAPGAMAAMVMVCVSAGEVLAALPALPPYTAVIEWPPTVSTVVVRAALPPLKVTGAPRLAAPSMNCTVPVGVLPVTVAVKVTDWPTVEGLSEETTVVLDATGAARGVTLTVAEAALVPAALVAVTEHRYAVPLVNP